MNPLEAKLHLLNPTLLNLFKDALEEVSLLLGKYDTNFSSYTDHSAKHTLEVFNLAANLMSSAEIENLNSDEIYILSMACLLHDVGMCIPENKLIELFNSKTYENYRELHPDQPVQDSLRDVHHELSYDFIIQEWEVLKIPNENYAKAIALVAKGHRKVELDNIEVYTPKFFVRNGREFVCLPYLASILRVADELDITNIRTPKLLEKYYLPENEKSIKEWKKHISTTQINFDCDKVIYQVKCSDQNNLAALEDQFEKIQEVIHYCQKIIRNISNTNERKFSLELTSVKVNYDYLGFNPMGIRFTFNVANVVHTFIGHNLYKNELTAIREAVQNAIDSCRYKRSILESDFVPNVTITLNESEIVISDNGLGMDEFIVQNFFGKLGSSFYKEKHVIDKYEAIGQFGVGVFSYFLLCDYIDIETKTKDSKPLKFRIDKDPKSYFHFYTDAHQTQPGTTITLQLKESIREKYSLNDYNEYLSETFRHIEFPLNILSKKFERVLTMSPLIVDPEVEIRKRIKIAYRNDAPSFTTISHYISNDEFEGECSLIIPNINELQLSYVRGRFDSDSFNLYRGGPRFSEVYVSQKGVFVTSVSSPILNYTFGNINIKKSANINISRNEFADPKYIARILIEFSTGLIKKLFTLINNNFGEEERVVFSYDFMDDFLGSTGKSYFLESNDLDFLTDLLTVKVEDADGAKCLTLNQVIEKYDEFVAILTKENNSELKTHLNCPVILVDGNGPYDGPFDTFKDICPMITKFTPSVIIIDERSYLKFNKTANFSEFIKVRDIITELTEYELGELLEFDNNFIITNIYFNKSELKINEYYWGTLVNVNHPFVKFACKAIDKQDDPEITKQLKQSFLLISNIQREIDPTERSEQIDILNKLVALFQSDTPIYTFTDKDFQKYIS